MKIEVRLFAYFRDGREKKSIMEFDDKKRVTPRDILNKLDIPLEDVSLLLVNGIDILINGDEADKVVLKNQDVVALFPPVGGG